MADSQTTEPQRSATPEHRRGSYFGSTARAVFVHRRDSNVTLTLVIRILHSIGVILFFFLPSSRRCFSGASFAAEYSPWAIQDLVLAAAG